MGVVLWYQIEFPTLGIKISSDVYSGSYLVDAEISITYAVGQPGRFSAKLKDAPIKVSQALSAELSRGSGVSAGVKIVIKLGYLDSLGSRPAVLTGRVESMTATGTFPPLGQELSGTEEASFLLLNTTKLYDGDPDGALAHVAETGKSPLAIVSQIVARAGAQFGPAIPPDPSSPLGKIRASYTSEAEDAFRLLDRIARECTAELLVQDGLVLCGPAVTYQPKAGLAALPGIAAISALITSDDSLILCHDLSSTRIAALTPVQASSTSNHRSTRQPATGAVSGFDFTVLGLPGLRAGQLVIASVAGYQDPSHPYRVLTVTHSFSPRTGYICIGRAVAFQPAGGNRAASDLARPAGPAVITDRVDTRIEDSRASFPAIDVGKIKTATAEQHRATVFYGQAQDSSVPSPSVGLDVPEGRSIVFDKPVAAPFAWHKVGLSVPVYPGMRALLHQVRGAREDSVVAGFLWADEPAMSRPPALSGDWWLCLPTRLDGTTLQPAGPTANDLTTADGRRVIEAPGLRIGVGTDVCTTVGTRPTPGDPDQLVISHASGTSITIDADGNVAVDGQGRQVVLSCGGATLTVGNGKVAIS